MLIFFSIESTRIISNYFVVALTIHRFEAVFFPIYHSASSNKFPVVSVITSVAVGVIVAYLPVLGWRDHSWNGENCFFFEFMDVGFVLFAFSVEFLFTFVTLVVLYGMIIVRLMKGPAVRSNRNSIRDKHIIVTKNVAIIVGVFLICKLPLGLINAYNFFCVNCFKNVDIINFSLVASHANSGINPIIYAYRNREIRETLKKMFSN